MSGIGKPGTFTLGDRADFGSRHLSGLRWLAMTVCGRALLHQNFGGQRY